MTEIFEFFRCTTHGLHGDRYACFECGLPGERPKFVPLEDYEAVVEENRRLRLINEARERARAAAVRRALTIHEFPPGTIFAEKA